jgi:hypothetical protein
MQGKIKPVKDQNRQYKKKVAQHGFCCLPQKVPDALGLGTKSKA